VFTRTVMSQINEYDDDDDDESFVLSHYRNIAASS